MAWLMAHQAILGALVVAIIDLAMALVPSLSGNGILHQIYLLCGGKEAA